MSNTDANIPLQRFQNDEIDLQKLWGLLLDNRYLIAAVTAAGLILGSLYAV
ncbi:MAG: hypothetical protein CVV10_04490, partial [Gammaproteobacteria bacterium HGW-Gammaproteobacteria-14]